MIVEFCGLPGAGKSTLQNELIVLLAQRGQQVLRRPQAVLEHIRATIWPRYTSDASTRRVWTAIYKGRLFAAGLNPAIRRRNPGSLGSALLFGGSMRLAEDIRLIQWFSVAKDSSAILDLSEGLAHHLAGCAAWREIAGANGHADIVDPIPLRHDPHERLVIHIDVPEETAVQRVLQRGVPASWPNGVPVEVVIDAFARGMRPALASEVERRKTTVICVDGTLAKNELPAVAAEIASHMEAGARSAGEAAA